MKKYIACLMFIVMIYSLTACSNARQNTSSSVVSPTGDKAPELTILINSDQYQTIKQEPALWQYIENFENQMGVKIEFDQVDGFGRALDQKERDDYMKKLASKLYTKNGPDLIFTEYFFFDEVIKQNVVDEVSSKISNISKIYPGLLNDKTYYVPIGMMYYYWGYNSKALQDLKVPIPEYSWTKKDYFSIWDKWVSGTKVHFNHAEYYYTYNRYLENCFDFKPDNNKLSINIPEAITGINQARQQIFGGSFELNKNYKYENYYNMLFEENSKEALDSQQIYVANKESNLKRYPVNAFRAGDIALRSSKYSLTVLPAFSDERPYINTMGFLVNKDSQHSELAYEFINGLLSDEVQMTLFNSGDFHYYPVNKDIEEEIKKIEADKVKDPNVIKLKEYALKQLNSGVCDTDADINHEESNIKDMLYKDLSKYILADKAYSNEELNKELNALVDKYNIYLNE